jgi:hypothetical protein
MVVRVDGLEKFPGRGALERVYYRTHKQIYAASSADALDFTLDKQTLVALDKMLGGR